MAAATDSDLSLPVTIVIGETGSGKSSLISALLKRYGQSGASDVVVGHSALSETKETTLHLCGDEMGYLLDTRGVNDSQQIYRDSRDILNEALRFLSEISKQRNVKALNVRIVWTVYANNRATADFQKQASFIQDILSDETVKGDWSSVCCVIQGGNGSATQNALLASAQMVARTKQAQEPQESFKNQMFQSDVYEWHQDPDFVAEARGLPTQRRLRFRYYTEAEYVENILQILKRLKTTRLTFEVKTCWKCGQKGDPRFLTTTCHSDFVSIHESKEKEHPASEEVVSAKHGELLKQHVGKIHEKTHAGVEKYHTGRDLLRHVGTPFTPEPLIDYVKYPLNKEKYHPEGIIEKHSHVLYVFTWDHKHIYPCCNRSGEGCQERVTEWGKKKVVVKEYDPICNKCKGLWNQGGCEKYCSDCNQKWLEPASGDSESWKQLKNCGKRCSNANCHEPLDSVGCIEDASLCSNCHVKLIDTISGDNGSSGGCQTVCTKCQQVVRDTKNPSVNGKDLVEGCIKKVSCGKCGAVKDDDTNRFHVNSGCVYKCCGKSEGEGCQSKCKNCGEKAGTEGCIETKPGLRMFSHNFENASSP